MVAHLSGDDCCDICCSSGLWWAEQAEGAWVEKEQDSIKRAQEEAHEKYIRKMARDIVNPGKGSKKRSNNMRGWDPASEDDLNENGMDRYMENDDETGWD